MSMASMMKDVVTLEKYTMVQDTSGGPSRPDWVPVPGYECVPCSIQLGGAGVQYLYAQRNIVITHTMLTDVELPLTTQMRVRDAQRCDVVYKIHGGGDEAGQRRTFRYDLEKHLR